MRPPFSALIAATLGAASFSPSDRGTRGAVEPVLRLTCIAPPKRRLEGCCSEGGRLEPIRKEHHHRSLRPAILIGGQLRVHEAAWIRAGVRRNESREEAQVLRGGRHGTGSVYISVALGLPAAE